MKKIKLLSILMAVLMVMSIPTFAGASAFNDVPAERYSWAVEAIDNMAASGIIKGYEDGTFKPENTVTKLESLVLTARILGVNDSENKAVVNAGIEAYGELIDGYNLNFGDTEVCYLLIKGIIDTDELSNYLEKSIVSTGMKRYEIAVLLTKALDAEDEVSKNLITSLDYTDAEDIPAYAKKYVEFVTNEGLMNGMDENTFSPNTSVTRAQAATLMNKLREKTNYTFYSGQVSGMDTASRVITVKTASDTLKYTVNASVNLRFEGADITANDIASGYDAVITLKGDTLYAIDFITPLVDKEVYGAVSGTVAGSSASISIHVLNDDDIELNTDVKESYPLSDDVVITFNGNTATIKELKSGTYVHINVKQGKAATIRAYDKTSTVSGIITGVEVTPLCKFYVELNDGSTKEYLLSSDVEVTRNGSKATAADVLSGDTVSLTTTYDRVTKVVASSKTQEKSGVIQEVIISASPKVTLKSDSGVATYNVTNACKIEITGKDSPSFYDLRAGVSATLTLEGDTVVALKTEVADGVTQVSGTVTSVNVSYGVIQVNYVDSNSGISVTEPVFVKSKATIIDILTGNAMKLSAVKEGSKVTAFGSRNSGIFEATTINVTNN